MEFRRPICSSLVLLFVACLDFCFCERIRNLNKQSRRHFKREIRNDIMSMKSDISELFAGLGEINKHLSSTREAHEKSSKPDKYPVELDILKKKFESEKRVNIQLEKRVKTLEDKISSMQEDMEKLAKGATIVNGGLEAEAPANSKSTTASAAIGTTVLVVPIAVEAEVDTSVATSTNSAASVTYAATTSPAITTTISTITPASATSDTTDTLTTSSTPATSIASSTAASSTTTTATTETHFLHSCRNVNISGVYDIYIESMATHKSVYCDASVDEGGWIVIMRRQDGSVDFNRTWKEYKNGFGSVEGEFWIGNKYLHQLTKSKPMELRVDMKDFRGNVKYATYRHFEIGSEAEGYNLTVLGYNGTAGDSLDYHNGRKFATEDSDKSDWLGLYCAYRFSAGWWYDNCFKSVLTGIYSRVSRIEKTRGIIWYTVTRWDRSLKFVEMKLR